MPNNNPANNFGGPGPISGGGIFVAPGGPGGPIINVGGPAG
jgi:hypothetical protein